MVKPMARPKCSRRAARLAAGFEQGLDRHAQGELVALHADELAAQGQFACQTGEFEINRQRRPVERRAGHGGRRQRRRGQGRVGRVGRRRCRRDRGLGCGGRPRRRACRGGGGRAA
jgi:hypothetical protein